MYPKSHALQEVSLEQEVQNGIVQFVQIEKL